MMVDDQPDHDPRVDVGKAVAIGRQEVHEGDVRLHMDAESKAEIPVHSPPRYLPARYDKFSGREPDLEEVHRILTEQTAEGVFHQLALCAPGGVGKTALAVEYAWRHRDDYPSGTFFLRCEMAAGAPPLHELGPHLGISPSETPEQTAARVRGELETGEPALLILDDVSREGQWRRHSWREALPAGECRRLITTRANKLSGVTEYPLGQLSTAEGVELLAEYRSDVAEARELVQDVVEWFNGWPVGLAVVGIYMEEHADLTWERYVDSLQERGMGAVRQTEEDVHNLRRYRERVDALFDDLMDALPSQERRTVEYAALLPQDQIYRSWLTVLIEGDEELELPKTPGYEEKPGRPAVQALVDREVLQERDESGLVLGLHRVLRARVRERLKDDRKHRKQFVDKIAALAEERGEASRAAVTQQELRSELAPLVALSEELAQLGRLAAGVTLANLMHRPLRQLGRYEETRAALERFLEQDRLKALPDGQVATLLAHHALTLKELGHLKEARGEMEQAVEVEEQVRPSRPRELAAVYSNLSSIHWELGNLQQAQALAENTIGIVERAFPADQLFQATLYTNLAMIFKDQGQPEKAREHIEQALGMLEDQFPTDHPILAPAYSNLAMILVDQGELEKARKHMDQAIEIEEAYFPPDHHRLARRYHNLGHLELAADNRDRACGLFRQAQDIYKRWLPPSHPRLESVSKTIDDVCE